MTLSEFFGCSMVAFGPAFSMFAITVAKNPVRVIVLVTSAFFWLLSLLVSSIFWWAISKISNTLILGVLASILIQESFRCLVLSLFRYADAGLQKVSEVGTHGQKSSNSKITYAYVSGLGFGLMSGAFSSVNVLADSIGPGTIGLFNNMPEYFFFYSSLFTLAFVLLHVFWSIIFFKAIETHNLNYFAFALLSHVLASLGTFLNQKLLHIAVIFYTYLITALTGAVAFYCAGGTIHSLKNVF